MRTMNRRWRGIDRPTNVLSFPLQELAHGEQPLLEALGDIAISLPVVRREASAAGLSFDDHLRRMLAHGLLHLLGYDHGTSDEERTMLRAEQRLLGGGQS